MTGVPPLLGVAEKVWHGEKPTLANPDNRPKAERRADAKPSGREFSELVLGSREEKDFRECLQQLGLLFSLVTRVVRADSPEAKASPGAQRAIEKEVKNVLGQDSLGLNETYEKEEVALH